MKKHSSLSLDTSVKSSDSEKEVPLQVQTVLENMPASQQSQFYSMSHLLAAGFRGSEYQLLVLMERITSLLVEEASKNFEAVVEIDGHGNLDDIGLVIKDKDGNVETVDAYQVKYYNHPIEAKSFFDKDDSTAEKTDEKKQKKSSNKKNEKMHIGKFFSGWLAWRAKYQSVDKESLRSILYSNAEVDSILEQCIKEDLFSSEFIRHEKIVRINLKPSTVKVHKNFLESEYNDGTKISKYFSKKIWSSLVEQGYLDTDGCFVEDSNLNTTSHQLTFSKEILPKNVKLATVRAVFQDLYDNYIKKQADFYEILFKQAWDYLVHKEIHKIEVEKDEKERKEAFQEFLESFLFQINQPNLLAIEKRIHENLSRIPLVVNASASAAQVFLCLYYAIREWFRCERESQKVPVLTNKIILQLIKDSIVRSKYFVMLQGRTEAALVHISFQSGSNWVKRPELSELKEKLKKSSQLAVIGEKGIGKSGLIKQFLKMDYRGQYIFLPAGDIVVDSNLRNNLLDVVTHIQAAFIVVLDGAEILLQLSDQELAHLLDSLTQKSKKLILTLTTAAWQERFSNLVDESVIVRPLHLSEVVEVFPELNIYRRINPLMRLICIPFYLSVVLKLIKQVAKQNLHYLINFQNANLEESLIKLIIGGQSAGMASTRRLAWMQLATQIASNSSTVNQQGVSLARTQGLELLVKDEIVVVNEGKYKFGHDLFFEYGLMAFLLQKWQIALLKGKPQHFGSRSLATL